MLSAVVLGIAEFLRRFYSLSSWLINTCFLIMVLPPSEKETQIETRWGQLQKQKESMQ
jgi:hypothetical protein